MDTQDRTILRRFFLGVALVVVIGVVVWGLFMRHTDKKAPVSAKNGSQQTATSGAKSASTSNTAAKTPANQNTAAAQPTQLVNTGPGNIVALFAGASFLGALAHYIYQRKLSASRA